MYNALIVGAGQIAAGFDFPKDNNVLTHAHAYAKHPFFNLLGFYDVNKEKAQIAAKKWNCNYYEDLSAAENVDVISICAPDNCHVESIKQAAMLKPQLIFLEKPITNNKSEIPLLLDVAQNFPIAVNYSRRYVREFQSLAKRIALREFGNFSAGVGYYGKGFIHNGSHMIDLLRLLIGDIKSAQKISKLIDFSAEDPSWNVSVSFANNAKFFMQPIDCNNFSVFELDLFFEQGRIRILDSGLKIEIYKIASDKTFVGYRKLQKTEEFSTELKTAMLNAVNNISNFLQGKEKLLCDIRDGYEAIKYA
jgi:predicted dehydrogenase